MAAVRQLAGWAVGMTGDGEAQQQELVQQLIRESLRSPGNERLVSIALDYLGDQADGSDVLRRLEQFARQARADLQMPKAS